MAWPTGMPLVTITQDVHKLPDGSLPSSYAVHLRLSVPALVFDGVTTLIRRSITLTAEAGSGVISGQVPHLNHPDLSPTPVYYMVTEFADGDRVRDSWQLTPAADDVTIDLDARAPIAGDPGTPVAVGPPGPAGADGVDGAPGADGLPGDDGAPGADGREVELQTTATHVQWRYVGDSTWTNLAALADLGSQTYASLDDVDLTGLADGDAMVWDATAERWVRVPLSDTYAPIPTGTPDGTKFYKDDGTWATPAGGGTGDVTGPAGAVAGNLAALDATGKVISDSGSAPADFAAASHTHAPADITGTAVITTDARLSDARTPTAHTHTASEISDATIATGSSVSGANTGDQDLSGYATTASLGDAATLDVGTTAGTVAAGDHTHAELHTHSNAVALAAVSGTNTGDEPDASTTVKGIVELATTTEATTGTDTTRAVTPAGVAAAIAGVGGGVTDHGALTGLADDDHTQYHTDDRGDARYVKKSDLTVTTGASVSGTNTGDQDLSGYVPTTRTINGDPLSANITLDAADVGAAPAVQSINAQTGTTYTLVAADASKLVTCTNAAAITVTVPDATFTAGQRVDVAVLGAGMVTLVGSGITLNPEAGLSLVSRAQYSAFTIYFLDATTAFVTGSMAAA